MEAVPSTVMSVNFYRTTLSHIPRDDTLRIVYGLLFYNNVTCISDS
jgi:hypothetical protein